MNEKDEKSSPVLICLAENMASVSEAQRAYPGPKPDGLEGVRHILRQKKSVRQISSLTFLADQNECFPELIELIQHCNEHKIKLLIAEVGELPVLLSPEYQADAEFLEGMGRKVRMLKRPETREKEQNKP
jgi:hypothetical protein